MTELDSFHITHLTSTDGHLQNDCGPSRVLYLNLFEKK